MDAIETVLHLVRETLDLPALKKLHAELGVMIAGAEENPYCGCGPDDDCTHDNGPG